MTDLDIAIQKRVDAEVLRKLAPIIKRFVKLTADCEALLATMDELARIPKQANGSAPQVKKPRAAISFTEGDRDEVKRQVALFTMPATISGVANASDLSSRLTGAILRDLVKAGKVVERPKGKFRAAVEAEAKNGLDGATKES